MATPEARTMTQSIVFFRIGWMAQYRGLAGGDEIHRGGSYVQEHGGGGEILNFEKIKGRCYGFVQTVSFKPLAIERLGASKEDAYVDGVTVVWVATPPDGGQRVVGWYKNARVFHEPQTVPNRKKGWGDTYFVEARAKDCRLLTPAERHSAPKIPREKGGMVQTNVWYADSLIGIRTVKRVEKFIGQRRSLAPGHPASSGGHSRNSDPVRRARVEQAAVVAVTTLYEANDFVIEDRQKYNDGWDLEARRWGRMIRIEVKGCSGKVIAAELTSNEYRQMMKHRSNYTLCVVTNALQKKLLRIHEFTCGTKAAWFDRDGRQLLIKKVVAARVRV